MEIGSNIAGLLRATGRDAIERAFERPVERLSREVEGTRVQISAFGQLRAATAAVEDAARGLRRTDTPRTAEATRVVARRFVEAVNAGREVAGELAATGNRRVAAGALADDPRVGIAAGELRQAVAGARNNGAAELRAIGITVGRDGTLGLDPVRFDQALAADPVAVAQTLDRVGERVASVAARQNSTVGSIGRAVDALSIRADSLEARRQQAEAGAEALQAQIRQQSAGNPFAIGAAQSYRQIFGL